MGKTSTKEIWGVRLYSRTPYRADCRGALKVRCDYLFEILREQKKMSEKRTEKRARLIRLIHVGKGKLRLSDYDYRAILEGVSGKTSSAELTVAELEQVLKGMKSLGFTVKKLPVKSLDRGRANEAQLAYIKGMWELVSREKTERALNRFVGRIAGVDHLRFLDVAGAQKVTLALRSMMIKAGYDPDGIPDMEVR